MQERLGIEQMLESLVAKDVHIPLGSNAESTGVLRITVFDPNSNPLGESPPKEKDCVTTDISFAAERLVFRKQSTELKFLIDTNKTKFTTVLLVKRRKQIPRYEISNSQFLSLISFFHRLPVMVYFEVLYFGD
jgi:hypothetical protein